MLKFLSKTVGILLLSAMSLLAHASLVQNPSARSYTSLNGAWQVIVDPYENGFYNHRYQENPNGYFKNAKLQHKSDLVEYDFAKSDTLLVPGDWNTQKAELMWYEGTIWYQRDFTLSKKDQALYVLRFGAVNYQATVYVNGNKVGTHQGGFTPFEFDVTAHLKRGDNFVVVKVDNRRERVQVPTVNTDWWNYGGITREVMLLELAPQYLHDYHLQLTDDGQAIEGWVELNQAVSKQNVTLKIEELGIDARIPVTGKKQHFSIAAQPHRWSPESPKLYDVTLSFAGQFVRDKIGFRTVTTQGENILLNGKSVYLKGISIHEESALHAGRAWSEEDARQLLSMAKALGCNFVRLAHYPHNEHMLRMADELGLMVWSEIPVYWTVLFEREDVYSNAEAQLTSMIERDHNRASIILWSMANETPISESRLAFIGRLAKKARAMDSSRLLTAALDTSSENANGKHIDDPLAAVVDVIGINTYCGWYEKTPAECTNLTWHSPYNKPVIISEFGAGALAGHHGDKQARWTEEYQADVYRHNLEMIDNMSFVRGMTPWILKDFRSPRRPLPAIQDFWNRKGLVSDKGQRKQAWYILNAFYQTH